MTRTRTRAKPPTRRQRRVRCIRCQQLKDPGELTQPSRGERLCEYCLLAVANEAATAAGVPEEPMTLDHGTLMDGAYTEGGGTLDGDELDLDVDDDDERQLRKAALYERRSEEIRARLGVLPNVQVPGWPARYGRVSASSLGTFSRCPEQWRRRYVLGEREATKGTMLTGSALHGVIEELWHHKMREGVDLPPAEFTDRFNARFDWEVDDAGGTGWVQWGQDKRGELRGDDWRERGQTVALAYLRHIAPRVWPTSAERLFVAHVAGVPIPVVGYIDFSTLTEKTDLKFGRNVKNSIGPDWIIQAHLHLLADDLPMTYHSLGWPTRDGSVSYRTPGDSPDLFMEKTAERYMIANQIVHTRVRQILHLTASLGIDEPWPDALAHPWACTTCDFRGECAHWHPPMVTL